MTATPRYYVCIDPKTRIVQCWVTLTYPATSPNYVEISADQYASLPKLRGAKITESGDIVAYTPPPPPLKDQAQAAMQSVQQQASMVTAMGETFGPQMRDYVRALRAIINGADTASTELPTMPNEATQ